MKFSNLNLPEFEKIATTLGIEISKPAVILLYGDLGAGKTTFSKSFIRAKLKDSSLEVVSPTFNLVQTYPFEGCEIWHVDLYRLKNPGEVEGIGLLEAFTSNYCLVEWPERLGDLGPAGALTIKITQDSEHTRTIEIEAP